MVFWALVSTLVFLACETRAGKHGWSRRLDSFKPVVCTNLPSWHYKGMQESNGGSTKHGPWYRMVSSVTPNRGIAIHMLTPSFFFELKTDEVELKYI